MEKTIDIPKESMFFLSPSTAFRDHKKYKN